MLLFPFFQIILLRAACLKANKAALVLTAFPFMYILYTYRISSSLTAASTIILMPFIKLSK